MPDFSASEAHVCCLFPANTQFIYNGENYSVVLSGKPRPSRGECKTDVYIHAKKDNGEVKIFKISVKQTNADFLENKMSLERAKEIFGADAQSIISKSILTIKNSFEQDYMVCFNKYRRTEAKTIKLGWKFELLWVESGDKSGLMSLTETQKLDVLAGIHLSDDKKDCLVDDHYIKNSGVADYMLVVDPDHLPKSANECMASIQDIREYARKVNMYFACKALNYRAVANKWDGDRPLSVYVDWNIVDGKLTPSIIYSNPLGKKGNEVGDKLLTCLRQLGIRASNFDTLKDKLAKGTKVY